MRKLFTAVTFLFGAVFGLLFSTKKGEEVRRKLEQKEGADEKMEVVAEEAKGMFRNFWRAIKGPLKKGYKEIERNAKKYGKEYGAQVQEKLEDLKGAAKEELSKDVKFASKKLREVEEKVKRKWKR
jgi:gas vesicle protein